MASKPATIISVSEKSADSHTLKAKQISSYYPKHIFCSNWTIDW